MKIDPESIDPDLCRTSIHLLVERCREWFKVQGIKGDLWFADDVSDFPKDLGVEPLHVIFFGSFLRRFLESGNWCVNEARLWVLCESARQVLVHLGGIPEERVAVIPRYELFPKSSLEMESPKDGVFTLVFAGRISPTKNIEMLLRTVYFLQTEQKLKVSLKFFGDFDNQEHPDQGRRREENFKDHILNVSRSLDWNSPPVWHPKVGVNEWLQKDIENPVLINFSTFICEDFDVSLAQAQSKGWPAWVSNWGGHLDAVGGNVLKIPRALIGSSHEPAELLMLRARVLAAHLARRMGPSSELFERDEFQRPFRLPEPLLLKTMDDIRRKFLSGLGLSASKIYRDGLEGFADTVDGKIFFSKYHLLFSGSSTLSHAWAVLVNDFHPSANPALSQASEICGQVVERAMACDQDVVFLSLRELKQAFHMAHLLSASRLILSVPSKEARDFSSSLNRSFPRLPPIEVWEEGGGMEV